MRIQTEGSLSVIQASRLLEILSEVVSRLPPKFVVDGRL